MYMTPNMLMELHKARQFDLMKRAETARITRETRPSRAPEGKTFMRPIANTLSLLGLR